MNSVVDSIFCLRGYTQKSFEKFLQQKKLAEENPLIFLEIQKSMILELDRWKINSPEEKEEIYRQTNFAILGREPNELAQELGTNLDPLQDERWLNKATHIVRNLDLNLMKKRFDLVNDFLRIVFNVKASPFNAQLCHCSPCLFLSVDFVDRLEPIFPIYDYLNFPDQHSLLLIEEAWLDMSTIAPLRYSKYKTDIEARLPRHQYIMPKEKLETLILHLKAVKAKPEGIDGLIRFFEYLIRKEAFLVICDSRM